MTPARKLSDDEVRELMRRRTMGERLSDLARAFDVSVATICNYLHGHAHRRRADAARKTRAEERKSPTDGEYRVPTNVAPIDAAFAEWAERRLAATVQKATSEEHLDEVIEENILPQVRQVLIIVGHRMMHERTSGRLDPMDTTEDFADVIREKLNADSRLASAVEDARFNAGIADAIFNARSQARITQAELAALTGMEQSEIAQMEDADYGRHTLTSLRRIASSLCKRLEIRIVDTYVAPS
jgi:DNA-binding XRE family transcriptional regulator